MERVWCVITWEVSWIEATWNLQKCLMPSINERCVREIESINYSLPTAKIIKKTKKNRSCKEKKNRLKLHITLDLISKRAQVCRAGLAMYRNRH